MNIHLAWLWLAKVNNLLYWEFKYITIYVRKLNEKVDNKTFEEAKNKDEDANLDVSSLSELYWSFKDALAWTDTLISKP